MRNLGLNVTIVGLLGALVGSLWHLFLPSPDANIGAGLLVVLGLPVAGLGGLLLLVSSLRARASSRTSPEDLDDFGPRRPLTMLRGGGQILLTLLDCALSEAPGV